MPSNTKEEVLRKLRQSLSQVENAIGQIERRNPNDSLFQHDLNVLVLKRLELQHKILQFTIPPKLVTASVSVSSLPAVLAAPPADPTSNNFSPLSFFGWTLAGVSVAGLIAWGLKSKNNMTTISDIVHTVNAVLKPGRNAPPPNRT